MKLSKKQDWRWEPNIQTKIATTVVATWILVTHLGIGSLNIFPALPNAEVRTEATK